MTISSQVRVAGPFTGNGTASTFSFAFKVFSASDLKVVRLVVATGIESVLMLNTDYTVTLNANQDNTPGGSIVLVSGNLPSGQTLTITTNVANLQPTDLTNQGGFYPEVITDALDRATIQIQQHEIKLANSLTIPTSDSGQSMVLPSSAARANSFLAFDSGGLPVAVVNGSTGTPSTVTRQTFSGTGSTTVFTLSPAADGLGNSIQVYVGGAYQQRSTYTVSNSGATLTFNSAPVAGTNNIEVVRFATTSLATISSDAVTYTPSGTGAVARSATSRFEDAVSVKNFGAVGNGVTNDTAAFNAAITFAGTRNIYVPGGTYVITGTVTGNFYSDSAVTISGGTVNAINRIGSVLSTTGAATIGGTLTVPTITSGTGTVAISNNATVGGTIQVTGNATLNGTITGSTVGALAASLLPSKTILQVVTASNSSVVAGGTGTFNDTGLTATITPQRSTSTIIVIVSHNVNVTRNATAASFAAADLKLIRGTSTAISTWSQVMYFTYNTAATFGLTSQFASWATDSAGGTSAITYKTQVSSSGTVTGTTAQTNYGNMIVLELAA